MAFLAMASHRLGRSAAARAYITRLRGLMGTPRSADDEDMRALAAEAHAVVGTGLAAD